MITLIEDLGMIQGKGRKYRYAQYLCDCGNKMTCIKYPKHKLNKVSCKPCGAKKSFTTHGGSSDRLNGIFHSMKQRCNNPKAKHFNRYGGRGIKVCQSWFDNYTTFKDWALKNGYKDALTIDREDNDGDYEPSNCRWVKRTIQSRNTTIDRKNNTSGFRGVQRNKYKTKWEAWIVVNSKKIYLGLFNYAWTGAYAYDAFVTKNNLEHTRNFL